MWSKWPHRLISTGILFFFVFALLESLRFLKVELWNAGEIAAWIGLSLVVIGLFTLKFEVADSDKE